MANSNIILKAQRLFPVLEISLLIVFLLAFVACPGLQKNDSSPVGDESNSEWTKNPLLPDSEAKACQRDSDCVLMNIRCCDCNAGGFLVAIHKSMQEEYQEKRTRYCAAQKTEFQICPQVLCEKREARCYDSRCWTKKDFYDANGNKQVILFMYDSEGRRKEIRL